ncbi:hypothetical protein RhiXN_10809 [Rhizoctonia solani]|uniref:DUF6535 domain-containing protein n=1 Tax=Rhizoctonia solani TaxID=456999 RepID=A0A8H8P7I0_9AGAM|nr:uncharacterized protein RhiXN_10809 [Rhizoctonia solani]QRW25732.1 hypothetical protein RhiXN_10809 [Rhizoctonia solani]
MKKLHDTDTTFRHIPTEYDSCGLGRDDPVWLRYITESNKWDAQLVEGWNNFLMEGCKRLQKDHQETIAAGIPIIVNLLQAIATNQPPSMELNATLPLNDFKPKKADIIINAMLVKQWGEGYRHGHDLSTPCVQARVRQARYDELKRWRTEDVALALPVLMHTALADEHSPVQSLPCHQKEKNRSETTKPDDLTARALEWLIGHSQNKTSIDIAIRAISDPSLDTKLCKYLGKALLIRLVAQKFTAIFNGALEEGECDPSTIIIHDAQLKKAALYGQALTNITKHISIQTISQDVLKGSAARHHVDSERNSIALNKDQVIAVERGLFSIALSENPATASSGVTCLSAWYTSTNRSSQSREKWKSMLAQLISILSKTRQPGRNCPEPISIATNQAEPEGTAQKGKEKEENKGVTDLTMTLGAGMIDRTVNALLFELAYWRWDLSKQEKGEIFHPLLGLFSSSLLDGSSRPGMSAVLAVMGILFSENQEFLDDKHTTTEEHWVSASDYISDTNLEIDNTNQDISKEAGSGLIHAPNVKRRSLIAQKMARIISNNPDYLLKYADSLLLIGLSGLLDSISVLGLGSLTHQIVKIVTIQLNSMPVIFHSGPVLLPHILPPTTDLRSLMADAVTRCLSPSPFQGPLHPFQDEDKALLLECIWDKSYLLSEFGHQLLTPILQLLDLTSTPQLSGQCLNALNEYFFTNTNPKHDGMNTRTYRDPVPVDWVFFLSLNLPLKLAEIMKESEDLRSKAIATFDHFMQIIPSTSDYQGSKYAQDNPGNRISEVLIQMTRYGTLGAFAKGILHRRERQDQKMWRRLLIDLPEWLSREGGSDNSLLVTNLRQFCSENFEDPVLTTLAFGLNNELDKKFTDQSPSSS